MDKKLFFQVINNKYLNKQIFKNDSFKANSFKFDEIISCEWLLINGYVETLKYKVKRGDYLTLDYIDADVEQGYPKKKSEDVKRPGGFQPYIRKTIFQVIQDDEEFYRELFKNYQLYFKDLKKTISYIIADDCLVALLVLYNEVYKEDRSTILAYLLTRDNVIKCLTQLSFKCLEFIYNINKIQLEIKESNSSVKPKYYLIMNDYWDLVLANCSKTVPNKFISRVLYLSNVLKININESFKEFEYKLPSILIYQKPLSLLLDYCYCIDILKDLFQPFIKAIKEKKVKELIKGSSFLNLMATSILEELNFEILSRDQLDCMKFTNHELETEVGKICSSNNNVRLLFSMAFPFLDYLSDDLYQNFTFYKRKYFKEYTPVQSMSTLSRINYALDPITFGDYDQIHPETFQKYSSWERITYARIFCYCPDNKEKQVEFVNKALKDIVNQDIPSDKKFLPSALLKMLVEFQDFDLIELFVKKTKEMGIESIFGSTFKLVKSTKVFDFLLESSPSAFNLKEIFPLNMDLVYHLEKNHPDILKDSLKDTSNLVWLYSGYSPKAIMFILENYESFKSTNINWDNIWLKLDLNSRLPLKYFGLVLDRLEILNIKREIEKKEKEEYIKEILKDSSNTSTFKFGNVTMGSNIPLSVNNNSSNTTLIATSTFNNNNNNSSTSRFTSSNSSFSFSSATTTTTTATSSASSTIFTPSNTQTSTFTSNFTPIFSASNTLYSFGSTTNNNKENKSNNNNTTQNNGSYNCFSIYPTLNNSSEYFKNCTEPYIALNYVYENRIKDIENNKCIVPTKEFQLYQYYTNNFEKLLLFSCNEFFDKCTLVINEIARRGDIEKLSLICLNYFRNSQENMVFRKYIFKMMMIASIFGHISIFQFLNNNYPSFYNIAALDQDLDGGIITNNYIQLLLDINFINGHTEIIKYLTQECFKKDNIHYIYSQLSSKFGDVELLINYNKKFN